MVEEKTNETNKLSDPPTGGSGGDPSALKSDPPTGGSGGDPSGLESDPPTGGSGGDPESEPPPG